ncbi:MAG: cytidine deaminase [Chloroflexota bacterium]|nr:cytidine deaminase [Chloroflexota bacterium]
MLNNALVHELVKRAVEARLSAYAPYSQFAVGAAIQTSAGRIYTGCNVENVSYGLSVCAERVAIWKAVAGGETEFEAIAVVTDNGGSPCGACRQVMAEFAPTMPVIIADLQGNSRILMVNELLLEAFLPEDLPEKG